MAAPKLRLVQAARRESTEPRTPSGFQQWLFPHDTPSLLIVFNTLNAKESEFVYILEHSQPRFMIDFRSVPRFDFGMLNRKQVFEKMGATGMKYLDLHDLVPSIDSVEWDLTSARESLGVVFPPNNQLTGPLLCLVESTHIPLRRLYDLASLLPQTGDLGWDVLLLPDRDTSFQFGAESDEAANSAERRAIFISHANPQDNDFVIWLHSRLLRAGYQVWADLRDLNGGDQTWDEIEQQIRFSAAKVIVVLSKSSQTKQGVLDEINLAVSVERYRKLTDFVIPIKLDELQYFDVRANLSRKNIIDFSKGWSGGLAALLRDMRNSGVKREVQDASANDFSAQLGDSAPADAGLISEKEVVDTNWLPIERFPPRLFFLELPSKLPRELFNLFPKHFLFFNHQEFIGTFSDETEVAWPVGVPRPKRIISFDTEQILKVGASGAINMAPHEARKRITGLLHKAWRQFALNAGLKEFEMSSRRHVYLFPAGFSEADKAHFNEDETKRSRKLVGRSEKRNVQWHLAIELIPKLTGHSRYIFRSHVLFSDASGNVIGDPAKQHSLRRGFCKSWWNDRWRTLMFASLNWLAKDNATIAFPVGANQTILMASRPMEALSQISLRGFETKNSDQVLLENVKEDIELDDFDDDAFSEVLSELDLIPGQPE